MYIDAKEFRYVWPYADYLYLLIRLNTYSSSKVTYIATIINFIIAGDYDCLYFLVSYFLSGNKIVYTEKEKERIDHFTTTNIFLRNL